MSPAIASRSRDAGRESPLFSATNTSKATGLCRNKRAGKWMAFIKAKASCDTWASRRIRTSQLPCDAKPRLQPVNPVGNPDLVPDADPKMNVMNKHNLPKYVCATRAVQASRLAALAKRSTA
ncbi:hypothetical protein HDU88_001203 [Geranomyces variabilis]|nr:hypothetical protein HDU88_001203 [Geranomyces variabilis]